MFARLEPIKKVYGKRYCRYCGQKFRRKGKYQRVCDSCSQLQFLFRMNNLDCEVKEGISKVIRTNYIQREKVKDSFTMLEKLIAEKQIWIVEDTTKAQYMAMKFDDLKNIINEQKERMEL